MSAFDLPSDARRVGAELLGNPELRTLYFVYFALFAVAEVYYQAVPLYFDALGISTAVLGLAWSVATGVEVAVSPATGVVSDRYDRFAVAIAATVVLGVTFAAFTAVSSALALVALMGAVSAGRLLLSNAITPAVDEAFEEGFEGIGWGVRDVFIYGGSAVGLGLGGSVVAWTAGIAPVFGSLAAVLLVVALVLWWRRRPSPCGGGVRGVVRDATTDPDPLGPWREISDWGVLARVLAVDGLVGLGTGMSLFLLPVFATDVGLSAAGFLFVFGGSHVVAAPLSVLGGALADRYSRKWLYVGNAVAEAAMLLTFGLTRDPAFFLVGIGLFVAQTAFEPAVIAYFFDLFDDEESGRAWSVDGMVSRTAGIVGPLAGGTLYAINPRATFLVGGGVTALGAAVALTLPE